MRKPTVRQVQKERSAEKMRRVLLKKGYPKGKIPEGKAAHHVIPVAVGGKTTVKNIRVIAKKKHAQIHKNRRKQGKI